MSRIGQRPMLASETARRAVGATTARGFGAMLRLAPLGVLLFGLACGESSPPRLLLLISVDTLRADALGTYGARPGATPSIDALARESVVFEHAYAPTPLTLPSMASVLTGRHPEALAMQNNESTVPDGVETLAADLSQAGWRTGAVIGNFVLRRGSGLDRGFDRFDDLLPQRERVRRWPERIASDTTVAAIEMVADCGTLVSERCFIWVHYQDPHGPYDPPGDRRQRFLDEERARSDGAVRLPPGDDHLGIGSLPAYQQLDGHREVAFYRAGYRGEVAFVDEQVGRLLDAVAEAGLEEESLVVFLADHGESLGEHGVWFSHGSRLTDEQVRVPLLLRDPREVPRRIDRPVALLDLRSTLRGLLGLQVADPGRDLLAEGSSSQPYLSTLGVLKQPRRAIIAEGHKLIMEDGPVQPSFRLYRLGEESLDLAASQPEIVARLKAELQSAHLSMESDRPETRRNLSPEDQQQLRALGYGQ